MKARHIRGKKRNTWSKLRVEIQTILQSEQIANNEFSEVNINEWSSIQERVWKQFSRDPERTWLWETLYGPAATMPFIYGSTFFSDFVNENETYWYILDESISGTKHWIYQGNIKHFEYIFAQSENINEVIIVSKKFESILILNHHLTLIGTGKFKKMIEEKVGNKTYM